MGHSMFYQASDRVSSELVIITTFNCFLYTPALGVNLFALLSMIIEQPRE